MAAPDTRDTAREFRRGLFVALVAVPVAVIVVLFPTPFGGWFQSFLWGTGVRWQEAYSALEMPESNLPRDPREREHLLLAWAQADNPPPRGMETGARLHPAGTLARLRYETLDHEGAILDTWDVRALVPGIGNGVGHGPCGKSCREELDHSSGIRLGNGGEPGISREWVLRMPVGETFDIEPSPLRTQDILDARERSLGIGSVRVGEQWVRNPARIRVTLVDACHGTVRVGTTMNLLFESHLPIPRGFETSRWVQLDGCGKPEPLPPPRERPPREPPAYIAVAGPESPDLRTVVVQRATGSGHVDLEVDEAWLREHRTPVLFQVAKVCRYDPAEEKWHELPPPDPHRLSRLAPLTPDQSMHGARVAYEAPREAGLFWIHWSEQDDGNRSANRIRWRDAPLFSGPILCNDVMLGPAPPGMVAMCVPFADRAEARFVPEPAKACGR